MEILEITPPRTTPTRVRGLDGLYCTRVRGKHHNYTGTCANGLFMHTRIVSRGAFFSYVRIGKEGRISPWSKL